MIGVCRTNWISGGSWAGLGQPTTSWGLAPSVWLHNWHRRSMWFFPCPITVPFSCHRSFVCVLLPIEDGYAITISCCMKVYKEHLLPPLLESVLALAGPKTTLLVCIWRVISRRFELIGTKCFLPFFTTWSLTFSEVVALTVGVWVSG
jgi:hypothetical protein